MDNRPILVYPTLYEEDGKMFRGPNIFATHWVYAVAQLNYLVGIMDLPKNAQLINEYKSAPVDVPLDKEVKFPLGNIPWPPEKPPSAREETR